MSENLNKYFTPDDHYTQDNYRPILSSDIRRSVPVEFYFNSKGDDFQTEISKQIKDLLNDTELNRVYYVKNQLVGSNGISRYRFIPKDKYNDGAYMFTLCMAHDLNFLILDNPAVHGEDSIMLRYIYFHGISRSVHMPSKFRCTSWVVDTELSVDYDKTYTIDLNPLIEELKIKV